VVLTRSGRGEAPRATTRLKCYLLPAALGLVHSKVVLLAYCVVWRSALAVQQ
jgi:hypothetical protein